MPKGSIPAGCAIHVKESALSEYKADEVWSTYELVVGNVFSYTYKGATLYYIINSEGNAMLVAPMWPYYDEDNDESWSGYKKPTGDVVVPDSVPFNGTMRAVTEVSHDAFYHCTEITSVTLPDSITSIGEYAFGKCYSLTSITIPDGVTEIPDYCFFNDTLLAEINFPAGLTAIGNEAFYHCAGPALLKLPAGLTTIGTSAFIFCDSIRSLSIPGSVSTIGDWAFEGCRNLQFAQLGEGIEGVAYVLGVYNKMTGVVFPSTLKVIDGFAFQYDSLLSSNLNLPDGFTTLGMVAYGDNQSLTTAQLPGTMVSVPEYAFWGCTSLAEVTFDEGITTIGQFAFYDCPSLHELTLPASLDSIGNYVFAGSTRIDRLVFRGSVPPAPFSRRCRSWRRAWPRPCAWGCTPRRQRCTASTWASWSSTTPTCSGTR